MFKSTGCVSARNALVEHYLPVIWGLSKQVKPARDLTLDVADFEQDATLSMMRAVELYDPGRNVKFETFVYKRIKLNAFVRTTRRWLGARVRGPQRPIVTAITFTDAGIDPNTLVNRGNGHADDDGDFGPAQES